MVVREQLRAFCHLNLSRTRLFLCRSYGRGQGRSLFLFAVWGGGNGWGFLCRPIRFRADGNLGERRTDRHRFPRFGEDLY